jgi:hypothetical protein
MSTPITIPCITLWRPWANWVALGWKPIETRTHERFKSLVGKRIAIHAAQKWDNNAAVAANDYLDPVRHTGGDMLEYVKSAGLVLCTAFVKEHRRLTPEDAPRALIECDTTRFGLFLEDIQKVEPPFAAKGSQGIWKVVLP